jgi:hypothetical protein
LRRFISRQERHARARPAAPTWPRHADLVQLVAEPVPLGPQLGRGQPLEIQAAGGVHGQDLAAGPGEGPGQLQVAVRLVPIGQVQLPSALRFGADHGVQADVAAGPGQLDIEPVDAPRSRMTVDGSPAGLRGTRGGADVFAEWMPG